MDREELIEDLKKDAAAIRAVYGINGKKTQTEVQGKAWEEVAKRIELAIKELDNDGNTTDG